MQFEINRTHIILASLVVTLVGAMIGEYYWLNGQVKTANDQAQAARLQADLAKGKGETRVVSEADLKKLLEPFSKDIRDAIKSSGEEVKQVINIKATGKSNGGGRLEPTSNPGILVPNSSNTNSVPVSNNPTVQPATFRFKDYRLTADIDVPNRGFKYTLEQRLQLRIVETTNDSGVPVAYAQITEYDDKGKEVSNWRIDEFTTSVIKPTGKQFYWWAPHLELGGAAGADFKGSGRGLFYLGFSPFAYGLTRNDNTFRLLQIGVGYDGSLPILFVSPAGYNLGEPLPLITDLWIWPSFGISDVYMVLINIGKTL